MRENARLVLLGDTARLVPYRAEHVARYHAWMTQPHLLALTASEPLTRQQEVDNQISWHTDPNKLTFIVCDRRAIPSPAEFEDAAGDLTQGMCGDVNAFFSELEAADDTPVRLNAYGLPVVDDEPPPPLDRATASLQAELEVMVAEPASRRRGIARESLLMLMRWVLDSVPGVSEFVVKVTNENVASLQLFKGLGFRVRRVLDVFEQTELRMSVADARERVASVSSMRVLTIPTESRAERG